MKKLPLILSLTLGLTTIANAETVVKGEWQDVSKKECLKAMAKGNFIGTHSSKSNNFSLVFYDGKLFWIRVSPQGAAVGCNTIANWE